MPDGYRLISVTPTDGVTVGVGAAATITAVNDPELGDLRVVKSITGAVPISR